MTSEQWREMERVYGESPVHRALGLSLEVPGEREALVHYDGAEAATNRRGHPAGGAIAEMVDSAVVQAAKTDLSAEDAVTTLELKINYLRSAPAGAPLTTRGLIKHLGRTTAVGVGEVRDASDALVAIGLVTVSIRRAEPPTA